MHPLRLRELPANSVHWLTACRLGLRAADAVLVGETGELDTVEYVRDCNALGIPKGLIVISHNMKSGACGRPPIGWPDSFRNSR